MAEAVITTLAKKKMLQARAGIKPLSNIVGMVFGDGAVVNNELTQAQESDTALKNELFRKPINNYEVISDTKIRYTCTLGKNELVNKYINEIALYDSDNDLVAIKTFLSKGKDDDMEMTFEIDDTFI